MMRARVAATLLSGVCGALALATLWLPPRIPAQDAPLYCFAVEVIREPERFAGLVDWGVPVSGGALQVAAAFVPWLDETAALKLLLSAGLVALWLALARLSVLVGAPRALALAVGSALFVGWVYAMGFFNFLLGACFALLAGSIWLGDDAERNTGRDARRALGWLLATYVHAVAAAMVAAPLIAAGFARWGWPAGLRRLWALAPAAVLLSITLVLGRIGNAQVGEQVGWVSAPLGASLRELPSLAFAAYSPWKELLGAAATPTALVLGVLSLRRGAATSEARVRRTLSLASAAFIALYFAAPLHLYDFFYAKPRPLLMAFALLGVTLVPSLPARAARMCEGLVLAFVAAVLALGVGPAKAEGERIAAETARLPTGRVGLVYVVIADERAHFASIPYQSVALHAHAYGTLGGGASAFTYPANPYLNPLRRPHAEILPKGSHWKRLDARCERDPRCFDPRAYARKLSTVSMRFDTVLLPFAPPRLLDELAAFGWTRIAPDAFAVGKATVLIEVPHALPRGVLVVRAGHPENTTPTIAMKVATQNVAGHRVPLFPVPAGPVRIEAFVDHDGDGEDTEGDMPLLPPNFAPLSLSPGERRPLRLQPGGE